MKLTFMWGLERHNNTQLDRVSRDSSSIQYSAREVTALLLLSTFYSRQLPKTTYFE